MTYALHLRAHALSAAEDHLDITHEARGWSRSIRAVGGYWLGSFALSEEDIPRVALHDFYASRLGNRLVEKSYGVTSWEGLLYEFRLRQGGREYRRSLSPELWHNKAKCVYTFPAEVDDEAGGAYVYDPAANSFQDASQDFNEWDDGGAGDATYSISVTNSDGTRAWGFLSTAFTTTNADDSILVFSDQERASAGWNGDTSGTPSTYEIHDVLLSGQGQETDWAENTDSSDIHGEAQYIVTLGGASPEAAVAMRDAHLTEFAWPRTRKIGSGGQGGQSGPAILEVSVAGYWATLNWQFSEASRVDTASGLISHLVGTSEFVTAGRMTANAMRVRADAAIVQRVGDLVEDVILQGDESGNVWQGGVYAGRKFVYEAAPTTVEYYERNDGVILDLTRVPVIPAQMQAGFLLRDENAPAEAQPPATDLEGDDPAVAYVDEIRFTAPNTLQYHIAGTDEDLLITTRQIAAGKFGQPGGLPDWE